MTAGAPSSFLTSVSVGAAQTITGDKTFTGTSTFSGAVVMSGGQTLDSLTVSGNTTVTGALAVTQGAMLAGSVGVGGAAAASAILTATSTTQGFLPPRMTGTQRDAIATPAAGLVVYNTTTNKLNFYNGSAWEVVTSA